MHGGCEAALPRLDVRVSDPGSFDQPINVSTRQPCFERMDAGMPFLRPISDRYFEDYVEGDVHRFGTIAVEADEIVAFAN